MALEQKLSLKLAQKLVMTPSLQQAIKLLQMTRLELEGVLTKELVENPVLEETEEGEEERQEEGSEETPEDRRDETEDTDSSDDPVELGQEKPAEAEAPAENPAEAATETPATEAEDPQQDSESMDDIDLDAYFNEYLDGSDYTPSNSFEVREAVPIENTLSREQDLTDHLTWQLQMTDVSPLCREIAELVIGNLDEDGFLVATVDELRKLGATPEEVATYDEALYKWVAEQPSAEDAQQSSSADDGGDDSSAEDAPASPGPELPGYALEDVEEALELVRSFDPPGVAFPDLRGSLLRQLEVRGDEESLSYVLLRDHWPAFMKRQFQAIAKVMGRPLAELEEPVMAIKSLETRPGRQFSSERTQYVEPDVVVLKVGDEHVIQLNEDGLPRLRVSKAYRKMLAEMRSQGSEAEAQQFLKEKMRSAVWLIKSLDQRQRTIYKVADSILRQQRDFFEHGIDFLRPMVLRDVAEDIGMHESTVSRVVSNKYIHTPRGLYPMKFFFHSGIDRDYGDDISSLTVKRKIQHLIQDEDPKRPLSDSELMRRLNREGIKIARRTVAKYRDELGIPSSTDRKQVF